MSHPGECIARARWVPHPRFQAAYRQNQVQPCLLPTLTRTLTVRWLDNARSPRVAELRDAYEPFDEAAPQYRKGTWQKVFETAQAQALFGPLQTRFFQHSMDVTKAQVWERVLSTSYIASLEPPVQEVSSCGGEAPVGEALLCLALG